MGWKSGGSERKQATTHSMNGRGGVCFGIFLGNILWENSRIPFPVVIEESRFQARAQIEQRTGGWTDAEDGQTTLGKS